MLVHIMDQPELEKGEGPIGIIVAPTRELSEQIHKETRRFSKPYNLRVCAAFGGLSKHDQFKDLKAGAEVRVLQISLFVIFCYVTHVISLKRQKLSLYMRTTLVVGGGLHTWAHDRLDQDEGVHVQACDLPRI